LGAVDDIYLIYYRELWSNSSHENKYREIKEKCNAYDNICYIFGKYVSIV
jgi:hypothetical protein